MGFPVSQAKKALAAKKSGQDVQAALESLLSRGSNGDRNLNERSPTPSMHAKKKADNTTTNPLNVDYRKDRKRGREREKSGNLIELDVKTHTSSTRAGPSTAADIRSG